MNDFEYEILLLIPNTGLGIRVGKTMLKFTLWAFVADADLGQLLKLSKYLESLGYTQISLLELIMINSILQGLHKMLSNTLLDSNTPREIVT